MGARLGARCFPDWSGNLFAVEKESGRVDGALYWGSGYREIAGTGNNKVLAFSLAGDKGHGEQSGDDIGLML